MPRGSAGIGRGLGPRGPLVTLEMLGVASERVLPDKAPADLPPAAEQQTAVITLETPLGPVHVLEDVSELPQPRRCVRLYADAETTSGVPTEAGFHPYSGHRACGWAVTWDDEPAAFYAPVRHKHGTNLPVAAVNRWLQDWLRLADEWTNHNVKFDAHFAGVEGVDFGAARLGCTLTRAKMLDSDRWSHDLKPLFRDWLGVDTEAEDEVRAWLDGVKLERGAKCQDYGTVPVDILGRYACVDVLGTRALNRHVLDNLPEEQGMLLQVETDLTPVLFDMEREGMLVDQGATLVEKRNCLLAMAQASEFVYGELGRDIVDSNDGMHDILINQLGLPILAWGDERKDGTRGPSFDKDAMNLYAGHPQVLADERVAAIVRAIRRYRDESRFLGLYVKSFMEKLDPNGRIHPTYNQTVRTGRMSCRDPNSQQLNPRAKRLIVPAEGEAFLCADASQAEFRMIVHYIRDDDAIAAYEADPKTDYHKWVADICGIGRHPAKAMNFMMAFGGGRKRTAHTLMTNDEVIAEVLSQVSPDLEGDARAKKIEQLAYARGDEIYETYHRALPGLKIVSRRAELLCKERGWIRNIMKRRRHLPRKATYKAFNTMIQGGTMDVIKAAIVRTSPRHSSEARAFGLRKFANVHDEDGNTGPAESLRDPRCVEWLCTELAKTPVKLRVPMVWEAGYSEDNWAEAKA